MATSLEDVLARWDSSEGRPYKGSLIDWSAYMGSGNEPPTEPPLGCMCAQGQVLHLIGGWEPRRLKDTAQVDADAATAKLLNISVAHAILLRNVNDNVDGAPSIVLTNPEKVLGSEASRLLDFWWHLDQMTPKQWDAARAAARDAAWAAARAAARDAARAAAGDAARAAAGDAARAAAGDAAWAAAGDAAWAAAWAAAGGAAANAASEIQGAKPLHEQGKTFFFLPMFGFDSPEAIPARPINYGQAA